MAARYDICVIGGGAGGLFAASVANTMGAGTCMIEKKRLGGDCTWFGCMPSKAILKAASAASTVRHLGRYGLDLKAGSSIDTSGVMDHVRGVVDEISTHHPAEEFERRGIRVIIGSPEFIGGETVKVNGETVTAGRFILCTGSHPVVPPVPGLKDLNYLTNESIFGLEKLPGSMIVLGGGPIGIELSQALNRLGVKITVVEMMDRILFREDADAAGVLEKALVSEGITLMTGRKAVKFERDGDRIKGFLEDRGGVKTGITAGNVLAAVGRAPNVEGLSLEKAGIGYSDKGVRVNEFLRTTNKNVFACGDIVGPYMFSHVAAYQAGVCVRNALFRRVAWQKADYSNVAWATFTEPELARLGLTEEEARQKHGDVRVYKNEYSKTDRAVTDLEKEGLLKVITDKNGFILGAHIAGAQAAELIQGLLVAKSLKAPFEKLARILYIYPTLSELVKKTAAKPLVEKMDNPLVKALLKIMKK